MDHTKSFTSGGVLSSLIRFAIPVLAAMFLQSLYGAVYMWGKKLVRKKWKKQERQLVPGLFFLF